MNTDSALRPVTGKGEGTRVYRSTSAPDRPGSLSQVEWNGKAVMVDTAVKLMKNLLTKMTLPKKITTVAYAGAVL